MQLLWKMVSSIIREGESNNRKRASQTKPLSYYQTLGNEKNCYCINHDKPHIKSRLKIYFKNKHIKQTNFAFKNRFLLNLIFFRIFAKKLPCSAF